MASLSSKLPVQVFRGLPRLGSFSAVQRVRDIEGPPWLGSYSIDQWVRHFKLGAPCMGSYSEVRASRLMGQPVYFSAADVGL